MLALLWAGIPAISSALEPAVSDLRAEARAGQVFLTWSEAETPEGTTFNVYLLDRPITEQRLPEARRVGFRIPRHSARNWWLDPASFHAPRNMPEGPAPETEGFRIRSGGKPLDPAGGLFVHTAVADGPRRAFFAVTRTGPDGVETRTLVPGVNTMTSGVRTRVELIQPIAWRPGARVPKAGSCRGRPVIFDLHGRGGAASQARRERSRFMVFGDARQGWVEGIPWIFNAQFGGEAVILQPLDAIWVGRPVTESPDARDHCPALGMFFFGCNEFIYDRDKMAQGRVLNYGQRRLLYLVRWAVEHLGCDPDRIYLRGGSMGGTAAVSMILHYPDVFAAAHAWVPVVSFTHRTCPGIRNSSRRLLGLAGPDLDSLVIEDGTPLLTHMNGVVHLEKEGVDYPPLLLINGRRDRSIPWCNNPEFYRTLNATRRGFIAAWNDGVHGGETGATRMAPPDLQPSDTFLFRFRRNESYPAFSNVSTNDDPGNGDPEDGDIAGLMNYGLEWSGLADEADRYAVRIAAADRGKGYPVTLDLTPRRLQRFRPPPGARLTVSVDGTERACQVRPDGTFTVENIVVPGPAAIKIEARL